MKQTLLTFLFFILIAVTNAHANTEMEQEILRQLDNIQQMGEDLWEKNLEEAKTRHELSVPENQPDLPKMVSNGYDQH